MRSSKGKRSATGKPPKLRELIRELRSAGDAKRASNLAWFFKTGKGEYGEGDQFLGITVPIQRKTALRYLGLSLGDLSRLLHSELHEHRFTALQILVAQYVRADESLRAQIVRFYLREAARINNWDLVDSSAPYILGEHLRTNPRRLLDRLAASPNIWERRMAIVSTFALIRSGETKETFRIAEKLLGDPHDLIHKAVGWALRETGKTSVQDLCSFLARHYARIPRTTLRYAIERFPLAQRKRMLAGTF
jgi:3-methyladenine DNA glycosylase AlkD